MNRIHSTDMNNLQFGKRIRTVRENLGYNQIEFCSLLNIPQSTLSAYETDRMQPTVASLMNIATKFNVSMDWLFGFEDEQTLSKTRLDIIKIKGNGFTAEIPINISPELLTVVLNENKKKNDGE